MLPACTSAQKPYVIGSQNSASTYADSAANTPGGACQLFAATTANTTRAVNAESCSIAAVTNAYPVIKVCDDTPTFTVEKMQDMATVWGLFLLAAIAIICARKILNIFDKAPHAEG